MITGLCNSEMLRLFDVGMRVKVSDRQYSYQSKKFTDKVIGAYGTVNRVDLYYEKIAVKLDGTLNELSATGNFFFKPRELEILDENNKIREDKNMSTIKNYLNIAKIKFIDERGCRTWEYANFDASLRPRDICVVMTANHGMSLAEVVEILPRNDIETTREIVAKVDTEAYDTRVAVRKQVAELKAKMEERAKQLQDVALYKMLAENDPAMMELLNEYQALTK